jgi:3-isopropylmalate dehydrogenase
LPPVYALQPVSRLPVTAATKRERGWLDCVTDPEAPARRSSPLVGVLPGEGIGPEVVTAAVDVLRGLQAAGGEAVSVEVGGPIGTAAEQAVGTVLPENVVWFCEHVFARGGAILSGPGGGRYVYDLRRRLDLYLKISPAQARNGLLDASPLKPDLLEDIDLLVVRENIGGVYQGSANGAGGVVQHTFTYAERDIQRFIDAAARLARSRRGELTVVTKQSGLAGISELWRRCAEEAAAAYGVRCSLVDVDLIAYRLLREPRRFDVIAASNLCGDVLGDVAANLVGSRALSFAGNFTPRGGAVYQTNHGAAYDLAGTDTANPVGQILALALLLRESLGLRPEAEAIERGVQQVWRDGTRTADLARDSERVAGTAEIARLVADAAAEHLVAEVDAA